MRLLMIYTAPRWQLISKREGWPTRSFPYPQLRRTSPWPLWPESWRRSISLGLTAVQSPLSLSVAVFSGYQGSSCFTVSDVLHMSVSLLPCWLTLMPVWAQRLGSILHTSPPWQHSWTGVSSALCHAAIFLMEWPKCWRYINCMNDNTTVDSFSKDVCILHI